MLPSRYTPALLPFIVSFIVVAVEGIGDITATEEASMLATTGTLHAQRIQGGILGDGAVPKRVHARQALSSTPALSCALPSFQ